MYDVQKIRRDFPTISPEATYFDSVASSLTPQPVVDAIVDYYTKFRANVHRGHYDLSMKASEKFEDAIDTIAKFINAKPSEIVITTNCTHAINEVALTVDFEPGDEVLLSTLEHSSNMVPWARLEKKIGIGTRWYKPGKTGLFDLNEFEKMITKKTKLVSLTYVSNVVGTIVPVEEVAKICRDRGILFMVDAAQAVPHFTVDVKKIGCDFLAFSGHKMLGPTGVGVLYVKEEHAEEMMPAFLGGGTIETSNCNCTLIDECNIDDCSFNELPYKWQAGTPPIASTLGMKVAVDYLTNVGFQDIAQNDDRLMERAMKGLMSIKNVDIFGPLNALQRKSIISYNVGELPAIEVGRIYSEEFNISVRAGDHCAVGYFKDVQEEEGVPGSVRASFYLYNTEEEVDRFLDATEKIAGIA
ncbi:MAG: cysteine desulfurase [Proteobacteria bacterium]|nr:cysteine desulfurase [Pseudomonadota bacterium]